MATIRKTLCPEKHTAQIETETNQIRNETLLLEPDLSRRDAKIFKNWGRDLPFYQGRESEGKDQISRNQ